MKEGQSKIFFVWVAGVKNLLTIKRGHVMENNVNIPTEYIIALTNSWASE